ncbi:MAG TPA: acyltransferase family protein, partial [Paraburkholderia sp.]|nr:acyltransferase family protein [Paraburkholderia sp.]
MEGLKAEAKSDYRADIDGLRAVAVIPVMLFHFHSDKLAPGGFVGVDIFFVISGFLITRLIHQETAAGSFTLQDFYSRRIRRIVPALVAMILFVLGCTFFTGFPGDVKSLSHNILAAMFSVSNIVFYRQSGYFDAAMAHNPLLHTWSLGVEEQFYFCFPLLMVLLRRRSHRTRVMTLGLIALASFAWAVFQVRVQPAAAFYLLPSRAWELMTGALLAIGAFPAVSGRRVAQVAGLAGLVLILGSIRLLSSGTPFPGAAALPPCIGAALIIWSGAGVGARTLVATVLSSAPFRIVGLISYSLYLWHWPIYVMYGDVIRTPFGSEKVILVGCCLLVSWLSYRFIETPFRRARRTVKGAVVAVPAVCAMAVFASASASAVSLPPDVGAVLAFSNYDAGQAMRVGQCFLIPSDHHARFNSDVCLKAQPGKKNVLLLGDSHAADLMAGFAEVRRDVNYLQANATGCMPVL